jgi:hypothetical protein
MRKFFSCLLISSLLLACNSNKKTSNETEKVTDSTRAAETMKDMPPQVKWMENLLGSFVGAFGDNKITLLITKAEGDSVLGRSIVGGNDRPFAGTFTENAGIFSVVAKEPGDHKDDGVFTFFINKDSLNVIRGTWKANDVKRPVKTYTLERKKFEYKMDVGDYPEASQRLLVPDDLEPYPKRELEFMRNEIFARHGYCFKKKELRQEFELQDWYVPNTVDIKGFLTDTEKKNIALIKRYEKYAEDYGDEYGR